MKATKRNSHIFKDSENTQLCTLGDKIILQPMRDEQRKDLRNEEMCDKNLKRINREHRNQLSMELFKRLW